MTLFGFGPGELMLILTVLVVVIGPERLPEAARRLGGQFVRVQDWWQRSPEAAAALRMREELTAGLQQIRAELRVPDTVNAELRAALTNAGQFTLDEGRNRPVDPAIRQHLTALDYGDMWDEDLDNDDHMLLRTLAKRIEALEHELKRRGALGLEWSPPPLNADTSELQELP